MTRLSNDNAPNTDAGTETVPSLLRRALVPALVVSALVLLAGVVVSMLPRLLPELPQVAHMKSETVSGAATPSAPATAVAELRATDRAIEQRMTKGFGAAADAISEVRIELDEIKSDLLTIRSGVVALERSMPAPVQAPVQTVAALPSPPAAPLPPPLPSAGSDLVPSAPPVRRRRRPAVATAPPAIAAEPPVIVVAFPVEDPAAVAARAADVRRRQWQADTLSRHAER